MIHAGVDPVESSRNVMVEEYSIYKAEYNEAMNRLEITDSLKSLAWCDKITVEGRAQHKTALQQYITEFKKTNIVSVFTIYAVEGVQSGGSTEIHFFVHLFDRWTHILFEGLTEHSEHMHQTASRRKTR